MMTKYPAGLILMFLCFSAAAMGVRFGFTAMDDVGSGISAGISGQKELHRTEKLFFDLYPGADIAFAAGHDPDYRPYPPPYDDDIFALEFALSIDVKVIFPVDPKMDFYIGPGMCIAVTYRKRDFDNYSDTDPGAGLNVVAGLDLPILADGGFIEMRGKIGSEFNTMKLLFGIYL